MSLSQYHVWLWIIFRPLFVVAQFRLHFSSNQSQWKRLDSSVICVHQHTAFNVRSAKFALYYAKLWVLRWIRAFIRCSKTKDMCKSAAKKRCTQLRVFCDLLPEKRRTRNDVVSAITRSKWQEPRKMRTNLLRIVVNHFVTRKSRHPL